MFGRASWNKLPECIFENFEIAQSFESPSFSNIKSNKPLSITFYAIVRLQFRR